MKKQKRVHGMHTVPGSCHRLRLGQACGPQCLQGWRAYVPRKGKWHRRSALQRVGPPPFTKGAQRTLMPAVPHTLKGRRTFALPCLSAQPHVAAVTLLQQPRMITPRCCSPVAGQDAEVLPCSSALLLYFAARFLPPRQRNGTLANSMFRHRWALASKGIKTFRKKPVVFL